MKNKFNRGKKVNTSITKIIQLFTITTQEKATEKQLKYIMYLFSQSKLNVKFNKEKDSPRLTKLNASRLIDCLLENQNFKFRDLDIQVQLKDKLIKKQEWKKAVYHKPSLAELQSYKPNYKPRKPVLGAGRITYEEMQAKLERKCDIDYSNC